MVRVAKLSEKSFSPYCGLYALVSLVPISRQEFARYFASRPWLAHFEEPFPLNVFVFDIYSDSRSLWQELAGAHQFNFHGYDRLDRLDCAAAADVLVVDQSVLNGHALTRLRDIRATHPYQQTIATGSDLTIDLAVDWMRLGVAYVLQKPLERTRLVSIIPHLLERHTLLAEQRREHQQLNEQFSTLTKRENDVLQCILVGMSNKDSAELLNVSVRTIESRRAKVYRKLQSSHVAELVRKVDRLEQFDNEFRLGNGCHERTFNRRQLADRLHGPAPKMPLAAPGYQPQCTSSRLSASVR